MNRTKDLWFASFLVEKGIDVKDINRLDFKRGEFVFDLSDEDWKKYKIEFSDSIVSRLKYIQEKLKDLIC